MKKYEILRDNALRVISGWNNINWITPDHNSIRNVLSEIYGMNSINTEMNKDGFIEISKKGLEDLLNILNDDRF